MIRIAFAAVVALATTAVFAHDYWLEPSSYTPRPGELVKIRMLVGEHLEGESVPRNDARIVRFAARTTSGETPVVGLDGSDPAGLIRPAQPGGLSVSFRSHRSEVELPPAKFEAYLAQQGLDQALAERARRGENAVPGREVYSRCARALLAVGGAGGPVLTKPDGLTLELVPESDPYAMAPGATLSLRLLYEGKPLAGALVSALDPSSASAPAKARTDGQGRVRFVIPRAGPWLIEAVHMIRAPSDAGADWESFWASVTFFVGPPHPTATGPS